MPPRACGCRSRGATEHAPGDVRVGSMESMTKQARELGMLDRLGLEQHLANRIRRADNQAKAYRRRMDQVLEQGIERTSPEGPVAGDADAAAVKWGALAEQAYGRGDKLARALHMVVSDRERRSDLERRERLAEMATANVKRPVRGVA